MVKQVIKCPLVYFTFERDCHSNCLKHMKTFSSPVLELSLLFTRLRRSDDQKTGTGKSTTVIVFLFRCCRRACEQRQTYSCFQIGIGSSFQQSFHHIRMSRSSGAVQRCQSVPCTRVHFGSGIQEFVCDIFLTPLGSHVQRCDGILCRATIGCECVGRGKKKRIGKLNSGD